MEDAADGFGRLAARPQGLFQWTGYAVEYPVLAPYAWLVEHVVLPNFTFFGWAVLCVEAGLGAFLLAGLWTRTWPRSSAPCSSWRAVTGSSSR